MQRTSSSYKVTGTIKTDQHGTILVLSDRLNGHDTFLSGQIEFSGASAIDVRILTLDDVTVLRVQGNLPVSLPQNWSAVLHLPENWRIRNIPEDLSIAANASQRDLTVLDHAELRYALTFLQEASTDTIRRERIDAIVSALPPLESET